MEREFELIIRNGSIYDGTGGPPTIGDVGIKDGVIAEIGAISSSAGEEIDAEGCIVTPGFIDVHTHYDGQLTWSDRVAPSSSHGVTTVVVGNCGVGFAPCRPDNRHRLVDLLEGVEDIPEIVMTDGLPWDWESFSDYVAALERRPHDIDFAVQLPHSALRVHVMGDRAVHREPATEAELDQMRDLAADAIRAGAFGVGTSRSILHRSMDGNVIPTAHTAEAELRAIAEGMASAGGGSLQALLDIEHSAEDFDIFYRVASETGSPFSYSLVQFSPFTEEQDPDEWRALLAKTEAVNAAGGVRVTGQVFPRPVGVLLGLDVSFNPFSSFPSYGEIAHLPLEDRVAMLRRPDVRARILADSPEDRPAAGYHFSRQFHSTYPLGDPPNYEPAPETSVAAMAKRRGVSHDEIVYDLMLENDGRALLINTIANYEKQSLDEVREMLVHPDTVPALGDGGAHYGMICDSTYTTFMLTYWGRDRPHGRMPIEQIVHALTLKPARMMRMTDRGVLRPGYRANLNIIDLDELRLHAPKVVRDLPAGGKRITQDADGYRAMIVGGKVVMRDGAPTGELPGRLVRPAARHNGQ